MARRVQPLRCMNDWQGPERSADRVRVLRMIRRLESRIRLNRELASHPRLEFAATRQIAASHRRLEVLRLRLR